MGGGGGGGQPPHVPASHPGVTGCLYLVTPRLSPRAITPTAGGLPRAPVGVPAPRGLPRHPWGRSWRCPRKAGWRQGAFQPGAGGSPERLPPQSPGLASFPLWAGHAVCQARLAAAAHLGCCLLRGPQPRWLPARLHMLVAPVACLLSCRSPVEGTWTLSPHSPALPGVLLGQTVQQPSPHQAQGIRRPSEGRSVPGVRVPDAHTPPALRSVLRSTICLAASCPMALALLSPPCTGQTVCLHVELGSSPTPWLSCCGCRCLLWSVGCPLPSPGAAGSFLPPAWRDQRAGCSRGTPGALTPRSWLAPLASSQVAGQTAPGPGETRPHAVNEGLRGGGIPPASIPGHFCRMHLETTCRAIGKVVWGLTASLRAGLWPASA